MEPSSRHFVFSFLERIGGINYQCYEPDEFHNIEVNIFFNCVSKLYKDPSEILVTSENMTEREKEITQRCLPQFARYFNSMTYMYMRSESLCLDGLSIFRIELLPILIELTSGDFHWRDLAISLIWWEERCRFYLRIHPDTEEVAIETTVAYWFGPIQMDLQSYSRLADQYCLTD